MCDKQEDLELWLFVDADLASDIDNTKSTSGAFVVLVGPSSWMPITWLCSKQTSTAKSTTEAEGVALVTALLQEAYPILDLLEVLFDRKVTLRIKEDNTATIRVLKNGYSSKLRHVLRTHKLNLGVVKKASRNMAFSSNMSRLISRRPISLPRIWPPTSGPTRWS